MESKTKQRILGFSVIIGLIALCYIFFQPGKEPGGTTTIVQAPPFPEQTTQVTQPLIEESPAAAAAVTNQDLVANTAEQPKSSPKDTSGETDNIMSQMRPSIISDSEQKTTPQDVANNEVETITNSYSNETVSDNSDSGVSHLTMSDTGSTTVPPTKIQDVKNKQSNLSEKKKNIPTKQLSNQDAPKVTKKPRTLVSAANTEQPTALEDDGLFKLTNAAWVIQIGSFKNKHNALKLVNQLRAKGYKAFIQQVSTTLGDSTRVFIGPEIKHGAARHVANRLEKEMHIHGIVISYKPLTL